MQYILIIFIGHHVYNGGYGGPTVATFQSHEACMIAAEHIKTKWKDYYKGHLCLNQYTGK